MEYGNPEAAVRDWLKTQPALVAAVGNDARHIDVEPPEGDVPYSYLVVFRAGGAPRRSWISADRSLLQFDCWGNSRSGHSRGAAQRLQERLVASLTSMTGARLTDVMRADRVEVLSVGYLPDPDGSERYVVTAMVNTTRLAAPAA